MNFIKAHLINMKYKIQFTDILKTLVQCLYKYLEKRNMEYNYSWLGTFLWYTYCIKILVYNYSKYNNKDVTSKYLNKVQDSKLTLWWVNTEHKIQGSIMPIYKFIVWSSD